MPMNREEKKHILKFLKTSFFVCLLFVVVLLPLELLLRKDILFYDRIKHQSDQLFAQRQNTIEWMFLGDSQIFYGIDPSAISTNYVVHNFAFASEPIATTYFKIKYALEKGYLPRIKKVWAVFDMSQLTAQAREGLRFEYDYNDVYNNRLLHDAEFRSFTTPKDWVQVLLYNSYAIRSRSNLLRIAKEMQSKEDSLTAYGFALRRSAMSEQDSSTAAMLHLQDTSRFQHTALLESNIRYYKKMIGMLQKRGVEVTLIRMPLIYDLADTRALQQENEELRSIIRSNFGEVRFINSALLNTGLVHSDFYDAGHLNYKGAQKLANALQE